MSVAPPPHIINLLLGSLPRQERDRVMAHCEPVELHFGKVLCEPDRPFRYLYFPVSGFISLVTTLGSHRPLELALIGNEGMLGATQVLGVSAAPSRDARSGSCTSVMPRDRRMPSMAFLTDKNIISIYDGSEDLNRETQFEKDELWKSNLINLKVETDWLITKKPVNAVLMVKKNKAEADPIKEAAKRFERKKEIDGWVLFY